MQRFKPPAPPPKFDEKMEPHRAALGRPRAGKCLKIGGRAPWGRFKPLLARAQYRKCGYCDYRVIGFQHGDVEHYRPKSEVSVLDKDPKTWGREKPDSTAVVGRKPKVIARPGYWWLTYDWRNYLLACQACNQQWKGTIFPVKRPAERCCPPSPEQRETPLLLNPFRGPEPCKHLHFRRDGSVEPWRGSKWGRETIRTCGLNRSALQLERKDKAARAHELADEFEKARGAAVDRILELFYKLGQPDLIFSGAVQAIFRQRTGISWQRLERFVAAKRRKMRRRKTA